MNAVVAGDGTLAYVPGNAEGTSRTLVWVDRDGRELVVKEVYFTIPSWWG